MRGQKAAPVTLKERIRKHGAGLGKKPTRLRFGNPEAQGGAPEVTMFDGDDEEGEEFLGDARVLQIANHDWSSKHADAVDRRVSGGDSPPDNLRGRMNHLGTWRERC